MHPKQKERLDRIEEIRIFIEKNQPLNINQIRLEFAAIAPRTLSEYLESLKLQGKIKTDQYGSFKIE